jgi:hypothetical protein
MTSQPDTFFVKVIAVVIGGVLLIPVLAFLRWLGTPLRSWEMRELIRNRREFLLVYQPYATPPASRMLTLLDDGEIGAGRNDNEYTWRVKRGCLEFFSEDGRLYSRTNNRRGFIPVRTTHVYEVRPRKDKCGVDLISDALPHWQPVVWRVERGQQCNRLRQTSQSITCAPIRVYDESGNVIETHEHKGASETLGFL